MDDDIKIKIDRRSRKLTGTVSNISLPEKSAEAAMRLVRSEYIRG